MGLGDSCCGGVPYSLRGGQLCCSGTLHDGFGVHCCGGRLVEDTLVCCSDSDGGEVHTYVPGNERFKKNTNITEQARLEFFFSR